MRRRFLVLVALLALVGCAANLTPQQQLFASCRGYVAAINSVTPVISKMNAKQLAAVKTARDIIGPICETLRNSDLASIRGSLLVVRAELRRLTDVKNEVKP